MFPSHSEQLFPRLSGPANFGIVKPRRGNWTTLGGQIIAKVVPGAYNGEVDFVDK